MIRRSIGLLGTLLLIGLLSACTGSDEEATPSTVDVPTIETTVVTPPPDAVVLSPGDDVQAAIDAQPAGTSYLLTPGTYRNQSIEPQRGDAFFGEPGAILTGAVELSGFVRDGDRWSIDGQTQDSEVHGSCEVPEPLAELDSYDGCKFSEQLFFDNEPLWQVTDLADLKPGRWYFDYTEDRIYVADDPTDRLVETSTTEVAFSGAVPDVAIRGLVIEKYANRAQTGAIDASGAERWTIEGNELRLNHGYGLRIGPEMIVRDNFVHHNGQLGIGGIGDGALVEGNEIAYNNTAGFHEVWEAGGLKLVLSDGLVIRKNWVHHNAGRGIWTDIDVSDLLVEDNLVEWNGRGGIVHEISYAAQIINNVSRFNGLTFDVWVWGAQILVQNSSDVLVSGNLVTVSAFGGNGIAAVSQDRGSGERGPYVSNRVTITDNTVRHLGNSGTNGIPDACRPENENVFSGNTYEAPAAWFESSRFEWCKPISWQQFLDAGQEQSGTAVKLG